MRNLVHLWDCSFFSEYLKSEELATVGDRMVARMVLTAETLQETEVQCLPGLVETHASVTFNVVEDNEYDEDVKYEYEYHH